MMLMKILMLGLTGVVFAVVFLSTWRILWVAQ